MKHINNPSWFNLNTGLLILRIVVGLSFLAHGWSKLGNMEGTIGFFAMLGLPAFITWLVALIETVGGIALVLGVYTRISALLIAIVMIGAIVTTKIGKPFMGGWELDIVFLATNLALAATGPGAYALKSKSSVPAPVL